MFAKDKHSSLLRKYVNYGQKMFYNIGPWTGLPGTKHSSVFQKLMNYDRKKFYNIELRVHRVGIYF
jgi:hypothetical protein